MSIRQMLEDLDLLAQSKSSKNKLVGLVVNKITIKYDHMSALVE